MYVLGIVGGVGSGKSAVANAFAQAGAAVLDADQLGHEVLTQPEVIAAFRQRWGGSVIGPDGAVVRREVASRVFGSDENATREREFLNAVTHPRIGRILWQRINALQEQGGRLVVLDAALLHETGWDKLCNAVVFVDAPEAVRRQRALSRGWTADEFTAREASQWPVDKKKQRAMWIIDNSGSLDDLPRQVAAVLEKIGTASD